MGETPKAKEPSSSERGSALSGEARALGRPTSAPSSAFGSFRKGRRKTGKRRERSAPSGGRKGGKKERERERWGNAAITVGMRGILVPFLYVRVSFQGVKTSRD